MLPLSADEGRVPICILDCREKQKQRVKCDKLAADLTGEKIWQESLEAFALFYGRMVDDVRRLELVKHLAGDQLAIPPQLVDSVRANKRAAIADVIGKLVRTEGGRELDPRLTNEKRMPRFVPIPPGPFWYGGERRASGVAEHDYELAMQRWPVTVGEYARFVDEWERTGRERTRSVLRRANYRPAALNDAGWGDLLVVRGVQGKDARQAAPFSPIPEAAGLLWERQKRSRWNHPVVYVSWFQAWAYCAWLTIEEEQREPGTIVVLPFDAEWERAARATEATGKTFVPSDSGGERNYPWRELFDADLANTRATRIGRTAPVGAFPRGNSGVGLWDVAGNVWEWCADACDGGDVYENFISEAKLSRNGSDRVLRGGSFWSEAGGVRCSYRTVNHPEVHYDSIGFRPARVRRRAPSLLHDEAS